jgi:hypothetical protein
MKSHFLTYDYLLQLYQYLFDTKRKIWPMILQHQLFKLCYLKVQSTPHIKQQ